MSENSTVKEKECDERRKDIYDKLETLRTDMDKMKGGIAVFKWVIPAMIIGLGVYIKVEISSALNEAKVRTVSTGYPSVMPDKWPEELRTLDATEESPKQ